MKILRVDPDSPASRAGLTAGDELVAVNGLRMRDCLDFLFATAEEHLTLDLERPAGQSRTIELARHPGEPLGIELPCDPIRRCGNRCVFCFIDQNPKGLRRSLYVKDEDYRHSLLYGNYLTLTNLEPWELQRILEQHLSPLYISVHATEPGARRRLLNCPGDGAIMPLLERLAAGGIEFHAQIVLVPRMNDGATLERTLDDLQTLHPALRSVAIVPVGLTRHRGRLPELQLMTSEDARLVVRGVEDRQAACLARLGSRLHFLADELYLLAGGPLPDALAYEGYPQIENGVGMVRRFEEDYRAARRLIPGPDGGSHAQRVAVVTGTRFAPLLAPWLERRLAETGESNRSRVHVIGARNELFGPTVTTAGLLAGRDMYEALTAAGPFDLVLLPPETLNADGQMLDGWTPERLGRELQRPVRVGFAVAAGEEGEAA
jgi:putative radical SAM enzyme (TIGR03279 family)